MANSQQTTLDQLKKLIKTPELLMKKKVFMTRLKPYAENPLMLALLNSQDIAKWMQLVSIGSKENDQGGVKPLSPCFLQQLESGVYSKLLPYQSAAQWNQYNTFDQIKLLGDDDDDDLDESEETRQQSREQQRESRHRRDVFVDPDDGGIYDRNTLELVSDISSLGVDPENFDPADFDLDVDEYADDDDTDTSQDEQKSTKIRRTPNDFAGYRPNGSTLGLNSGLAVYVSALLNEYQENDAGIARFIGHDFGPLEKYLRACRDRNENTRQKYQLLTGKNLDINLQRYTCGAENQIDCCQLKFKNLKNQAVQPDLYLIAALNGLVQLLQASCRAAVGEQPSDQNARSRRAWEKLSARVQELSNGHLELDPWLIAGRVMIAMFEPNGTTLSVYFVNPESLTDDAKRLLVNGVLYSMPDHAMIGSTVPAVAYLRRDADKYHHVAQTSKLAYPIPLFMKSWSARVAMFIPHYDDSVRPKRSYVMNPDALSQGPRVRKYLGSVVTGRRDKSDFVSGKINTAQEYMQALLIMQSRKISIYRADDAPDAGRFRFRRSTDDQIAQPLNFTLASAQQLSRDMISTLNNYRMICDSGSTMAQTLDQALSTDMVNHLMDAQLLIDVTETEMSDVFDYASDLLDQTLKATKTNNNLAVCRMLELNAAGVDAVEGATAFDTLMSYLANNRFVDAVKPTDCSLNIHQSNAGESLLTSQIRLQAANVNADRLNQFFEQLATQSQISYNDFSEYPFLNEHSLLDVEIGMNPSQASAPSQNDVYPIVQMQRQRADISRMQID